MKLVKTKDGAIKYSKQCKCGRWLLWFMLEGEIVSIGSGEYISVPHKDGRTIHKSNAIRCSDCRAEYKLKK